MHRTNIFLTDEQQRRLDAQARELGVTKSEVVRRLLDRGLGVVGSAPSPEEAVLAGAGIWADRDDVEISEVLSWRREVPLDRLRR